MGHDMARAPLLVFLSAALACGACKRSPEITTTAPSASSPPSASTAPSSNATPPPVASTAPIVDAGAPDPVAVRNLLARGFVSGRAMRLDLPPKWDAKRPRTPTDTAHVAGMAVRKGSERAVASADLEKLAELLRDPRGFEDNIRKRCAMGHLVGFHILRRVDGGAEERIDIALDTTCAKLFIISGNDAAPDAHATHYDPSHAAFIALVKRVLPDDKELKAVR